MKLVMRELCEQRLVRSVVHCVWRPFIPMQAPQTPLLARQFLLLQWRGNLGNVSGPGEKLTEESSKVRSNRMKGVPV
jgi:hypothetical protein